MKKEYIILALVVSSLFTSCYKDNEEELYPTDTTCDTENVSYSSDIEPILNNYCYSCHGNSTYTSLGSNIQIEGYDNLKRYVDDESFYNAVSQNGKASPMPKNASKLDDCSLSLIEKWIENGAKND